MISKGCLCEPRNYTAPLLPPSIRNGFHRVKEKIVEYFLSAQKVLHQTVKRKIIVENCKLFVSRRNHLHYTCQRGQQGKEKFRTKKLSIYGDMTKNQRCGIYKDGSLWTYAFSQTLHILLPPCKMLLHGFTEHQPKSVVFPFKKKLYAQRDGKVSPQINRSSFPFSFFSLHLLKTYSTNMPSFPLPILWKCVTQTCPKNRAHLCNIVLVDGSGKVL